VLLRLRLMVASWAAVYLRRAQIATLTIKLQVARCVLVNHERKYNPQSYGAEIVVFLHMDDRFLDAGYSLPLKRDAWQIAEDVEAAAVVYMMSQGVQDELVGLLEKASACTLDIERKNNQDKKSETKKVTGCSRASRNSILRRYLVRQKSSSSQVEAAKRNVKAAQKLNVRALAIHRRPELLSKGRGQLKWEKDISAKDRAKLRHQGDEVALNAFIDQHRPELENELDRRRAEAQLQEAVASAAPVTGEDWIDYLRGRRPLLGEACLTASRRLKHMKCVEGCTL
jgi:hypothetical protein